MNHTLLDYYKAIENTSTQMLAAAEVENWDEVVRLEGACAVLIEQLRHKAQEQTLPKEHRAEKNRIMLAILRHDAQIRSLAEPWLNDLDRLLSGQPAPLLH